MRVIRYFRNRSVLLVACLSVAGCQSEQPVTADTATPGCGADGRLETRLYGAVDADIRWTADHIACEGMPRPEGRGARLRLSGPLDDAPDSPIVALILGIPDLDKGKTGKELPTNVTLVQEGAGRFFGTSDTENCWTDVTEQVPLEGDTGSLFRVSGTVYCVSPLAELNGGASIGFTELSFSGQLNWQVPE